MTIDQPMDCRQIEDRVHRIGPKVIVVYTDPMCKETVDYHILRNLNFKENDNDNQL